MSQGLMRATGRLLGLIKTLLNLAILVFQIWTPATARGAINASRILGRNLSAPDGTQAPVIVAAMHNNSITLRQVKLPKPGPRHHVFMINHLFRCNRTGMTVQVRLPAATPADRPDSYEAVTCPACLMVHLVNKTTGKVLGERERR